MKERKKKRKAVPNKRPVEDLGNHKQEVLKESVRRSLRRLKNTDFLVPKGLL